MQIIPNKKHSRNSLRQKLWADNVFAHMWLVHYTRGETICPDGCNSCATKKAVAFYESELE